MSEKIAVLCCDYNTEEKILNELKQKKIKPLYKFSFIVIPFPELSRLEESVSDVIVTVMKDGESPREVVEDCISDFCF